MSAVNKVFLSGNIGQDPETRYSQSGVAFTRLSLATSERYKGKDGQRKDVTDWHNLVSFNKAAEILGEYLKKGSKLQVWGHLHTRKYQDKSGSDRYITEIVVDEFNFLGDGKSSGNQGNNASSGSSRNQQNQGGNQGSQGSFNQQPNNNDFYDDDIPF